MSFTHTFRSQPTPVPLSYIDDNFGDLSNTEAGKGASLVGVQDAAGVLAATNVEAAIAELATRSVRPQSNSAASINAAAALAASLKCALDLSGQVWSINSRVTLTGVPFIICNLSSYINVDVTGTYANGYAVEIGDPSQAFGSGRSDGTTLVGSLMLVASSRSVALHGVYMKGSFMNIGHVRAYGFNGTGINQDSVWDSTVNRLSVELCGNTSNYAIKLSSSGDTHNATHIISLQCEQAYHKGIYASLLRDVVHNIHSERLAILSVNDGTPNIGYMNHYVLLSNSKISQAVFTCLTSGTAPDGSALAAAAMNIKLTADGGSFCVVNAAGNNVYVDYGTGVLFEELVCANFTQSAPATRIGLFGGNITGTAAVEQETEFHNCTIGTLAPAFNAQNLHFYSGSIATVNFASNILGDISFNNTRLQTIGDTKNNAAGRKAVTFNDCNINVFNGAYNADARINGGYIGTAAIADHSRAVFDNVDFGSFSYTGTVAWLTRNCRGPSSATWAVPGIALWPAGTVTERVGYNAAGKTYQNTDGGTTWTAF